MSDSPSNPLSGVPTVNAGHWSYTGADHAPGADGGGTHTYPVGDDHGSNPVSATETIRVSETRMPTGRGGSVDTHSYGETPFEEGAGDHYPIPTSTRLRTRR